MPYMCPSCGKHMLFAHNLPVLTYKMSFYTKKITLLLSGFELFTLKGMLLGTIFHQKLIDDGLTCTTHVLHVEKTCFVGKKTDAFCSKTYVFHTKDTCRTLETIINQFLVKKYP